MSQRAPSKEDVEKTFQNISIQKYGKGMDFAPIIEELSKLKKGGALTYPHLEKISDPKCFPSFGKYWRWPTKEQIEDELKKTNNLFKDLLINEEKVIKDLYDIFKHLELVSIILRFVDPKNFGIYSPPVAKLLHLPRWGNYADEYQNYNARLRNYRDLYLFDRVDYVEMFLWALETGDHPDEAIRALHQRIGEENIEKVLTSEFAEAFKNWDDFERAKKYLKGGLYRDASLYAGFVFADFLNKECIKHGIDLRYKYEPDRRKSKKVLIEELARIKKYREKKDTLHSLRKDRNATVHPEDKNITRDDYRKIAERMINALYRIFKTSSGALYQ
jgi:hypothetical protein